MLVAASFGLAGALVEAQLRTDGVRRAGPQPPAQPATGFGGRDYLYAGVEHEAQGEGAESYWIFRPSGVADACGRAQTPPIVFLHGWGAMDPYYYGAWIEHLVRRGHVVVYPRYQDSLRTPGGTMTDNVVTAVRDAFARLDVDCSWAVIGHSLGGALAANLAVRMKSTDIGAPIVVLAVEPGRALEGMRSPLMALEDLSVLDGETVLVTVAGDADRVVGDRDAREIFAAATSIPSSRKRYVIVRSDHHGRPALEATHHAPTAPLDSFDLLPNERSRIGGRLGRRMAASRRDQQTVDALDYYAFWKLADGLIALAASGTDEIFSPENVRVLADMGRWSDGQPVTELVFFGVRPL